MNRKEMKEKAKKQLGNSIFCNTWLMAVLICFIYSALIGATTSLSIGILGLLIAGPLAYGISYIFLNHARDNQPMKLEELFKGFSSDFGNNFILSLMSTIFIFLWLLLFIIPGIIKAYAYSMAFYVKVDHPEYNWKQCLDESIKITNGHKMELFILDLSFIGWYIVGALCLGIGIAWVEPYKTATKANYYEKLKELTI